MLPGYLRWKRVGKALVVDKQIMQEEKNNSGGEEIVMDMKK
jgi:hypothetical protein